MKLAIIGSRNFTNYDFLKETLDSTYPTGEIETIISGGAKGADSLAEEYAKERKIPTHIFPAEWNKYGKSAGYIRNEDIINAADHIIAFWDGKSPGTRHSINLAKQKGKHIDVFYI